MVTTKAGDATNPKYKKAIRAKDIKETYDWETQKYTCILPQSPYKAKNYTFAGWKKDGRVYKPGEKYISGYSDEPDGHNAYFEAAWKPNFKKPEVTVSVNKKKRRVSLKWDFMLGAEGYIIYMTTKKNGKYKLIKTIRNKLTTSWTDKKIKKTKRGKKFYYKVAAYKKSNDKTALKKSAWVMISAKAAKVKSVKLSKSLVQGKVGKSTKIKAAVKFGKGKKLSTKVRWYTSNKKIAKINSKGKITFLKKGACHIWAKAHNGKNSSKIKVTVK